MIMKKIGNIRNHYGCLFAKQENKKYYWGIECEVHDTSFEEIPEYLHDALLKFNKERMEKEYLLKIEIFDNSGNSLGIEHVVGEKENGKFIPSLPSVFDYPANYFEGTYKVLDWELIKK